MLSNAYFLAKFRFDTAENEPAKNLQKFAKFANFADPNPLTPVGSSLAPARARSAMARRLSRDEVEAEHALAASHPRPPQIFTKPRPNCFVYCYVYSNSEFYLQKLASIQPRTSLFNFLNFNPPLVI